MTVLPGAKRMWESATDVKAIDDQWSDDAQKPAIEEAARGAIKTLVCNKILDLGCGTARYAEVIPYWTKYVGVDSSEHMLDIARPKFAKWSKRKWELVHMDLLEYEIGTDFDLVLLIHVSQHHSNPFEIVDKVFAKMHPKQHLLTTFVYHEKEPHTLIDFKVGWDGDEDGQNIAARATHRGDVDWWLKNHNTLRIKELPVWYHEDAKYLFALVRK